VRKVTQGQMRYNEPLLRRTPGKKHPQISSLAISSQWPLRRPIAVDLTEMDGYA
jgi:hypothetical protein